MADNETQINLRFKVNDDGSIVLDKIGKSIQKVEDNTTRMNSSMGVIKVDSLINLASRAFSAGEQLYSMAKRAAEGMSDIKRMAEVSGMSTDQFQKMAYAAKMSDVDIGTLSMGMKKLSVNMDEAGKSGSTAANLFERIGLLVKDTSGKTKSLDEIMGQLADKFSSWEEGPRKIAIAIDLFGKSGERLIPHLNKGAAGIREFYQEAEKLGVIISEKTLAKGADLEDQFKKAESFWASLAKRVVVYSYDMVMAMEEARSKYAETVKTFATGGGAGLLKGAGPDLKGAEAAGTEYLRLEAAYKRTEAPAIAAKELNSALEKNAAAEAKLNAYYADDVELLKQANREIERRAKGIDIMGELGVKTKIGAEKEISGIQEKYKMLMGQGYSPEEMEQARVKLEQQLQGLESKYKTESGWKATGEEGGVRWWSNEMPKEGIGADISGMVKSGIDELNRMQKAAERATGPKTIEIDFKPVQDANEMVLELRRSLEDLSRKQFPITLTIGGRGLSGNEIEAIEEGLTTRFINKQSRFRSAILDETGRGGE